VQVFSSIGLLCQIEYNSILQTLVQELDARNSSIGLAQSRLFTWWALESWST